METEAERNHPSNYLQSSANKGEAALARSGSARADYSVSSLVFSFLLFLCSHFLFLLLLLLFRTRWSLCASV